MNPYGAQDETEFPETARGSVFYHARQIIEDTGCEGLYNSHEDSYLRRAKRARLVLSLREDYACDPKRRYVLVWPDLTSVLGCTASLAKAKEQVKVLACDLYDSHSDQWLVQQGSFLPERLSYREMRLLPSSVHRVANTCWPDGWPDGLRNQKHPQNPRKERA